MRSNPLLLVAIVGVAILILAWIGWAIHVSSDDGARAGLGVLIAWPAMLAALALISVPFIGGYRLIRRLSAGGGQESDEREDAEEGEVAQGDAKEDQEEGAEPEARRARDPASAGGDSVSPGCGPPDVGSAR